MAIIYISFMCILGTVLVKKICDEENRLTINSNTNSRKNDLKVRFK